MKIHRLLIRALLVSLLAATLPLSAATKRILVMGDSWSALMTHPIAGVLFQQVLDENGYKDCEIYATEATAVGGSRADQWASNQKKKDQPLGKLDTLRQELEAHPTIDIVFVVIGGNDYLGKAKARNLAEVPAAERSQMWTEVRHNIGKLVDFIQGIRPGLKVVLCDYDYLNIAKAQAAPINMNFHGISQADFNEFLLDLGREKLALMQSRANCYYVNNWGLMQRHFGDPDAQIAPGQVTAPGGPPAYTPYAGGDPKLAGPAKAFDQGFGNDGIHLNAAGYKLILKNALDQVVGGLLHPSGGK